VVRSHARTRACVRYVCARTTRVCLASVACARRRRTTHIHTRNFGRRRKRNEEEYISLLLSLRVAHRRSRFAKPAPKVPPYRSHSLASLFLSFSPFLRSRRRLAVCASWMMPDVVPPDFQLNTMITRTANQPPTNQSNRPTALHYPPSTIGAQPLPCTEAATAAVATATGVRRHPCVYPLSLCLFPACSFLHPLSLSLSFLFAQSNTGQPPHTHTHTYVHSRLREPVITPPFGGA